MKRFSTPSQLLALALTIILIISACSARVVPQTTPTIDIAQQVTAIAGTFIAQVETKAAANPTATGTATPPAPTATLVSLPDFTQTALAMPTSNVTATVTPTANPYANDPCVNQLLPDVLTGQKIKIRIDSPVDRT